MGVGCWQRGITEEERKCAALMMGVCWLLTFLNNVGDYRGRGILSSGFVMVSRLVWGVGKAELLLLLLLVVLLRLVFIGWWEGMEAKRRARSRA